MSFNCYYIWPNGNPNFQGVNKVNSVDRWVGVTSTGFFGRKFDCSAPKEKLVKIWSERRSLDIVDA